VEKPDAEREEVAQVFRDWGFPEEDLDRMVGHIAADQNRWRDFMMKFELDLEKPDPKRAVVSALTIAGAYIVGGMIPLSPYFFVEHVNHALFPSIGMTLTALFVFGYVKAAFTGVGRIKSALQTTAVGGLAAAVAYGLAKLIGG
ncbi:MAG: VIT1/CCC1 transporter family protein, partial [Verrucomicrobiota bacterium]